jgi:ABC-type tungstate transport system substrate-binding protein
VKEGRGGARARFVYAHLLASLEKGDEARSHLAAALEASERAKLDHPLLREARARFIAPVDAGFVKLAGG